MTGEDVTCESRDTDMLAEGWLFEASFRYFA